MDTLSRISIWFFYLSNLFSPVSVYFELFWELFLPPLTAAVGMSHLDSSNWRERLTFRDLYKKKPKPSHCSQWKVAATLLHYMLLRPILQTLADWSLHSNRTTTSLWRLHGNGLHISLTDLKLMAAVVPHWIYLKHSPVASFSTHCFFCFLCLSATCFKRPLKLCQRLDLYISAVACLVLILVRLWTAWLNISTGLYLWVKMSAARHKLRSIMAEIPDAASLGGGQRVTNSAPRRQRWRRR